MTAEALGLVEALAALELESDPLGAAELVDDLGLHTCAINEGGADRHAATFAPKKNLGEFDFGIDINIELLDIESVAFLDAVLFTACFDYCVGHCRVGKEFVRLWAGAESNMIPRPVQGFFAFPAKSPENSPPILI